MVPEQRLELTRRQREILSYVVGEYVATGQPVGSKHLVEQARLPVSASTVRNELAELEARGLLTHPHTSTGRVTKQVFVFEEHVDQGLANWAREYLNDRLVGVRIGSAQLRRQLDDEPLSNAERAFLDVVRPAFVELADAEQRLFVGDTAGLLDDVPDEDLVLYRRVLATLEKRAALLEILGQTLDPRRPFVRVGGDFDHPAFHDVALVGASYGLTNRVLGAVSLLGPVRMDYAKAIRSVRGAAHELSRFVEDVYEDN